MFFFLKKKKLKKKKKKEKRKEVIRQHECTTMQDSIVSWAKWKGVVLPTFIIKPSGRMKSIASKGSSSKLMPMKLKAGVV
jgi:hypothetical protein